ncbi:MAG: hypothetical protein ACRC44_08745 [Bifidobacterium asteroides]
MNILQTLITAGLPLVGVLIGIFIPFKQRNRELKQEEERKHRNDLIKYVDGFYSACLEIEYSNESLAKMYLDDISSGKAPSDIEHSKRDEIRCNYDSARRFRLLLLMSVQDKHGIVAGNTTKVLNSANFLPNEEGPELDKVLSGLFTADKSRGLSLRDLRKAFDSSLMGFTKVIMKVMSGVPLSYKDK